MEAPDHPPTLLSIGHSNHSMDRFIALLAQHGVEVLVDVRSQPYSRYTPHFNHEALREAVQEAGRKYLFLGRELGGRPEGLRFYDADGRVRYDLVAETPLFLEGIARLERGIAGFRVAMMCSEENPAGCHRHRLVGRVLARRGVTIMHIRGDGTVQTDEELQRAEAGPQLALFEVEEPKAWKSIPSVLRKVRQSDFSDD